MFEWGGVHSSIFQTRCLFLISVTPVRRETEEGELHPKRKRSGGGNGTRSSGISQVPRAPDRIRRAETEAGKREGRSLGPATTDDNVSITRGNEQGARLVWRTAAVSLDMVFTEQLQSLDPVQCWWAPHRLAHFISPTLS